MSGDINNVFQKLCYRITMIYLINVPNPSDYRYWMISDTRGAMMRADTPARAFIVFKCKTFKLKDHKNNYSITEHEVLSNGKSHGRILAKANTIQSLINNYPEYFI